MKHVKTGMGVVTLLAAFGLTGVAPAEAQAAECGASGNRVGPAYTLYSPVSSEPIGSLEVYYNQGNGGTNSACLHHQGAAIGEPLNTRVYIARCSSYYSCDERDSADDVDQGFFKQYAGPAAVTGTRRKCVYVQGLIEDPYGHQLVVYELSEVGCEATPRSRYHILGKKRTHRNETNIVRPAVRPGVPVPVEVIEIPTNDEPETPDGPR